MTNISPEVPLNLYSKTVAGLLRHITTTSPHTEADLRREVSAIGDPRWKSSLDDLFRLQVLIVGSDDLVAINPAPLLRFALGEDG